MTNSALTPNEQNVIDTLVSRAEGRQVIPGNLAADFMAVLRAHVEDMDIWNSDWEELRSVITFEVAVSPDDLFQNTAYWLHGDETDQEIVETFGQVLDSCWEDPCTYCIGVKIRAQSGSEAWIGLYNFVVGEYSFACAGATPLDLEEQFRARGDIFPHTKDLPSGKKDSFTEEEILTGVKALLASKTEH